MRLHLFIVFVLAALSACNGSSSQQISNASLPRTNFSVADFSPRHGDKNVPIDCVVEVYFAQDLDAGTVQADSFLLLKDNARVSAAIGYAQRKARLIPHAPLQAKGIYTVQLTSAILNQQGQQLKARQWSFTVEDLNDLIPPHIVSTSPADEETNVRKQTSVEANFSEKINPASVTEQSFWVEQSGQKIAGQWLAQNRTAVFKPSAPLQDGLYYTATVTAAIQDLAGNALAANYSWIFTPTVVIRPEVTATFPLPNGKDTALGSNLYAWFSMPLQANSLSTQTFYLESRGMLIPGSVVYDNKNNLAILYPEEKLLPKRSYTATLTQEIVGINGNHLKENFSWQFSTEAQQTWTPPENLLTTAINNPQIAMNERGQAWIAWYGLGNQIFAMQYSDSSAWQKVNNLGQGDGNQLQIATDEQGNALAVWSTLENGIYKLLSKTFSPSTGWQIHAHIIQQSANRMEKLQLAMDRQGQALIVWQEIHPLTARNDLWSNHWDPFLGWQTAGQLDQQDLGHVANVNLLMDRSGIALVLWSQYAGFYTDLYARSFTPLADWSAITTLDRGIATKIAASTNHQGSFVALWKSLGGLRAASFDPAMGWSGMQALPQSNAAGDYQVSVEQQGEALALWHMQDQLAVSHMSANNSWSTPQFLQSGIHFAAPQLALLNNALGFSCLWLEQNQGSISLNTQSLHLQNGWSTVATIVGAANMHANSWRAANNQRGLAITLWLQEENGVQSLWCSWLR